jgi:CRP/FNR family transcriptional regulator
VRIASALLALIERFCAADERRDSFEVKMTRQELAELTGTTCETVSRVVKTMERDGLLDLSESGKVNILDVRGLEGITQT